MSSYCPPFCAGGLGLRALGNSGNSTEPHPHAVRGRVVGLEAVIATAEAMPLTFDGRFPTRNTIVRGLR